MEWRNDYETGHGDLARRADGVRGGGGEGGGISQANFRCFANLVMSRVAYAKEDRFPLATGFASKA